MSKSLVRTNENISEITGKTSVDEKTDKYDVEIAA